MHKSNILPLWSKLSSPFYKTPWLVLALIFFGSVLNLLYIIPALEYACKGASCGLWIGEWHYHDALWHVAVSRISFNSIPFIYPSASGFNLSSYNYLLGFILHILETIKVSPFFSYFTLLPTSGNIILGYSLIRYFKVTNKTLSQSIWILFFTYFVGSLSYLLLFYGYSVDGYSILKGFPVATTLQPSFVQSNIQFFLSLPIFILVMTDMINPKISRLKTITHSLLLAICIGLKIYSSVFVLSVLVFGYFSHALKSKNYKYLLHLAIVILSAGVSYLLFYIPFESYVNGIPFIFSPLSIPHTLTESSNLFYNYDFTLGRYYMIGLGKLSPKLIFYESISALIFLAINLSTRIFFPFYFIRQKLTSENIYLLFVTVVGFLVPIIFIQRSGGWYNSIQFAYLGIYTSGILSALFFDKVVQKSHRLISILLIIAIIGISIPNTIFGLKFLFKEKILISDSELDVLEHLKNSPEGIVLSMPDSKNSSYVPALSQKVGYFIDEEQAALLNLPYRDRLDRYDKRDCTILNEVNYVYLNSKVGEEFENCAQLSERFQRVYTKDNIRLYSKID